MNTSHGTLPGRGARLPYHTLIWWVLKWSQMAQQAQQIHCYSSDSPGYRAILAYQSHMSVSTQGSGFIGRNIRLSVITFFIW